MSPVLNVCWPVPQYSTGIGLISCRLVVHCCRGLACSTEHPFLVNIKMLVKVGIFSQYLAVCRPIDLIGQIDPTVRLFNTGCFDFKILNIGPLFVNILLFLKMFPFCFGSQVGKTSN